MAILGQSPLTNILQSKELEAAYQPLLIVEIGPFPDGAFLFVCTENLDGTNGGFQYNGGDYRPRIRNQDPGSVSAVSENGIVQSPQIALDLADADNFIWTQYEVQDGRGFKGVQCIMKFVFWDAGTTTFSTDERYVFVGQCNPPTRDGLTTTVTATNLLNMTKTFLPPVRIQRRCAWIFPTNGADRADAATNQDSAFYECGYSPDYSGTEARGNNDPSNGQPYTDCSRSWDACLDRLGNRGLPDRSNSANVPVQIERDQAGRKTGRFGGSHWDAPDGWKGRTFETGNEDQGTNDPNTSKYNDYYPFIYGKCFVEPPVMNILGNPNATKFEVVLCVGQIHDSTATKGPIEAVLVNDFWVPHSSEMVNNDANLTWNWVSLGSRDGSPNRDLSYDGQGDPYGSLACIVITVHRKMHDSTAPPKVRVLTQGPQIRTWGESGDPADVIRQFTKSPVWAVADMLTWGGWQAADLDLANWFVEAAYCIPGVQYDNLIGGKSTHSRYECGFAIRQRASIADILRPFLAGFKAILRPNPINGKLQILIKKTLTDQQGLAYAAGTNLTTAIGGPTADGGGGSGYVCWDFNSSNIVWENSQPQLKIDQRPIADTPNRLACSFQDEDYFFANDSIVLYDDEDLGRVGQEIGGTVNVSGVVSYDQCLRAMQTQFAEQFRGNPRTGFQGRNDTGGTWIFGVTSTFKIIHLRVGDIVSFTFPRWGIPDGTQARVISITPTQNSERIVVRAQLHQDDWYLDSHGQNPAPLYQAIHRQNLLRPPFGWLPNQEAPWDGDALFDPTEKTFAIDQWYEAAADGVLITSIRIVGKVPVNSPSKKISPPYAPSATYTGGGTIQPGSYWCAICGIDTDGVLSAPSWPLARIDVPNNNGGIVIPNVYFGTATKASHTVGWKVYAGTDPNKLSLQAEGVGTPTSVAFTEYKKADEAMPDIMLNKLRVKVKTVFHSGVLGAAITEVGATSLTVAGAGWTAGQWDGRFASVIGQKDDLQLMGVWDFRVTSNTGDTLNFENPTGGLDLAGLGISVGDAVVVRTKATDFSENTIGDSGFINSIDYYDPPFPIYAVSNFGDQVAVVTTVPNGYQDGDTVFIQQVRGNLAANGRHVIETEYEPSAFLLLGLVGDGDYEGGGLVSLITTGMEPGEEKGRLVRIIAGTGKGQVRRILDNDRTTLTIDGVWDVMPDGSSSFIVEDSSWLAQQDTSPIDNSDPLTEIVIDTKTNNFLERTVLVQVFTVTADGRESIDPHSPFREIYLFGGPANINPDFVTPTFVLNETATGNTKTNLIPIRRNCYGVETTVTLHTPPAGSITIDIRCKRASDNSIASIYNAPLVIPAGGAQWDVLRYGFSNFFQTDLLNPVPMNFFVDDVMGLDILVSGDSAAILTVVVKCHLGTATEVSATG